MKLPGGERAVIDRRKLVDYCLSIEHEDGCHKARLFASIAGITVDNAELLINALLNAARDGDAAIGKSDQYGQRYLIDFEFIGPSGSALIRSAWIVRPDETVPRLVTCYIL
jgi:hypothetical protein